MPLRHDSSDEAFKENLKAELDAGKPKDQALAIAYDVQRRSKKRKMKKFDESEPRDEHGRWTSGDAVPMNVQNMVNRINRQAAHREVKPSRVHADRVKLAIKTRQHLQNKLYGHGSEKLSHQERMDGERRLRAVNYHLATLAQAERYITKTFDPSEPRDDHGRWTDLEAIAMRGDKLGELAKKALAATKKAEKTWTPEDHGKAADAHLFAQWEAERIGDKPAAETHKAWHEYHLMETDDDYELPENPNAPPPAPKPKKGTPKFEPWSPTPPNHGLKLAMDAYDKYPKPLKDLMPDVKIDDKVPPMAALTGTLARYRSDLKTVSIGSFNHAKDVPSLLHHELGHAIDHHLAGGHSPYTFWSDNNPDLDAAIFKDRAAGKGPSNMYHTYLSHAYQSTAKHAREIFADAHASLVGKEPIRFGTFTHEDFKTMFPNVRKVVAKALKKRFPSVKLVKQEGQPSERHVLLITPHGAILTVVIEHGDGSHSEGSRPVSPDEVLGGRKVSDYPIGSHLLITKDGGDGGGAPASGPTPSDTHTPNTDWKVPKGKKKKTEISVMKNMPRYVARQVVNTDELREWCEKQGIRKVHGEFHVTVAYSRRPFPWTPVHKRLTMKPQRSWHLEKFGGQLVLCIEHEVLNKRWKSLRNQGASWDYDAYKAHITLAPYDNSIDLNKIAAPKFSIILGPEYSMVLKQYLPREEREAMKSRSFAEILKASSPEKPDDNSQEDKDELDDEDVGDDNDDSYTGDEQDDEDGVQKNVGIAVNILKVDEEQRIVYGFASVSSYGGMEVTDLQNDVMDIGEVSKAAHDFMMNSRTGGNMHDRYGTGVIVESFVLDPVMKEVLGITRPEEGWIIGYKVTDDDTWSDFKSGKFKGFSIGGTGVRTPID